jgi:diguanylate cyclase (GGDEF)-like protein
MPQYIFTDAPEEEKPVFNFTDEPVSEKAQPEESGLSGQGNIDVSNRPQLRNKDGSISTVRSISIGTDQGEVLIPTVGPSGEDWTDEQAIENYKKTGKHLGVFKDIKSANDYAQQLHEQQAEQIKSPKPQKPDYLSLESPMQPLPPKGQYGKAFIEGGKDVIRNELSFLNAANEARARYIEESGNPDLAQKVRDEGKKDALIKTLDAKWLEPDGSYKKAEGLTGYLEDVVGMMPQIGMQIATSVAGGPVLGGAVMATQIAGGDENQLKQEGIDPERRWKAALGNAFAQAPLEQIGIGKALKVWKPGKAAVQAIKAMAESGGTEFLTETVQQWPDFMSKIFARGKGKAVGKMLDEFTEGWWNATKEGMYQGAVAAPFGMVTGGAGGVANKPLAAPEIKTEKTGTISQTGLEAPEIKTVGKDERIEMIRQAAKAGQVSTGQLQELYDSAPEGIKQQIGDIINEIPQPAQQEGLFPQQSAEEQAQIEKDILTQRKVKQDPLQQFRENMQKRIAVSRSDKEQALANFREKMRMRQAAEQRQGVIDKTNIEAENEIERNRIAREQLKQEAEQRRQDAEKIREGTQERSGRISQEGQVAPQEGRIIGESEGPVRIREPEDAGISQQEIGQAAIAERETAPARKMDQAAETAIPEFKDTNEAVAFGEKATPEQLAEIKRLEDQAKAKESEFMAADDFSANRTKNVYKIQLYREVLEASRGEHPSQLDKRTPEQMLGIKEQRQIPTGREIASDRRQQPVDMGGAVEIQPAPPVTEGIPQPERRAGTERRQDLATRKRVAEMTQDEMRNALLTDDLTGLPNRRAYQEAEKKPVQIMADIDSLKWVNDNLGHAVGDELIKRTAEALKAADIEIYRIGGDEFPGQGTDQKTIDESMKKAYDYLNNNPITVETPDGKIQKFIAGFSYGTGTSQKEADQSLNTRKQEREASGKRAARGERPPGFLGASAEGKQVDNQRESGQSQKLEQQEPAKFKQGDQVQYGRAKFVFEESEGDRAIISNDKGEQVVDVSEISPWEPKKRTKSYKKKERITLSNVKLLKTLKDKTGSSEIANDVLRYASDLIIEKKTNYKDFTKSMRKRFANVWSKISKYMLRIWNSVKGVAGNQRGEIKIGKESDFDKLLDKLVKQSVEYDSPGRPSDQEVTDKTGGRYKILEALEGPVDEFVYWVVDKNQPMASIQKKLDNVSDGIDLFLKETQRPKRTAARVKKVWDEDIRPFMEAVAKSGLNLADVEEYAHAKHAPEANQALTYANSKRYYNDLVKKLKGKDKKAAQDAGLDSLAPKEWNTTLNEAFKKYKNVEGVKELKTKWDSFTEKPSGMTNQKADDIINKYKGNKEIENLRKMLSSINDAKLDVLHDAGIITDEEYKSIKEKYEYYVPLYREGYDDFVSGSGRGLKPSGRPIKVRGGSTKKVVNIVGNSVANYEKAINLAEKARSTKALKELVEANPDPDFWSLINVHKSPHYDSSGNLRTYPNMFSVSDNEFRFMSDGKQYMLEVNKDNKNAMLMLKTLKAEPSMTGPILNQFAKVNRFLARVNTSWSPEFILSNFIRDLQTAGINIKSTNVKAKAMLSGAIKSGRAIFRVERGKQRGDALEKMYERFKEAGGKIGWADVHGSVENLSKKITKEIESMSGKRPVRKTLNQWLDLIENTNTSIENGVRLHTFKLAVDQGISDERAAQIASDLTVDFTKRGAAGPIINSLYLFANAGIQGSYRILRATKSKSVRRMMAGVFGAGFVVGLANSMAGDDEDGEDYFNKIDDFIRERNAIFMVPGTKGGYAKIPLPWGYNFVWNLGTETSRIFTKKNYSPLNGAARMASTFFNAFNPIASGTLLQTLAPTVADPFVQVAENKNWFGGPLMPEENIFDNVPTPDSQRYWKSARTPSIWVSKTLNDLTGGDKIKPGLIDVSPETLDLVIDNIGGSALRFFSDTLNAPIKLIKKEELQFHEIPFWRRVAGQKSEYSDQEKYFDNIERVMMAKDRLDAYKGTDYYQSILKQTEKELKFIGMAKASESSLRKLRKYKKRLEASGRKKMADKIKDRMDDIYVRFNKEFNK